MNFPLDFGADDTTLKSRLTTTLFRLQYGTAPSSVMSLFEKAEAKLMKNQYVEQRDQGYWVSDSRVSLESVIFAFLDGLAPETIVAECFPTLSLEQVYGTITYYLSHRPETDAYLREVEVEFKAFQQSTSDPDFSQKLAKARREMQFA